jgi:sn-glycerol 3-phosphate transport system substrate-binding protein
MIKTIVAALALVALGSTASMAATELTWWHAMGGANGDKLNQIVDDFNKSQSDYHVTAVFKGTYPETLTAAIAAFRAHQQPAIVQVFEVGTGTMMAAKGAVYPVYQLMKDEGEHFDPKDYLPSVTGYYSDTSGNLLSFPFNSSTPIMYYNKDEFKKAGLDPNTPPKTWADVEADGKKLLSSGAAKCGFTTGWPSWIQLENLSAIHDKPYGTKANGFGGLDTEFTFNGPLQARHWDNLKKWQDEHIFRYGGPVGGNDAPPLFYTGECAIYMNSSASRADVIKNSKGFEVGFAPLPYYDDVTKTPLNSIIGGASLWVLQGQKPEVYKGVAKFFSYLSSPKVQADWHQFTGYLPITTAAYDLGKSQGYYEKTPGADVAIKQMTRATPTENSKGVRFGNLSQVRDVVDSELEQVLAGKKTGQQALDESVSRGNEILRAFQSANQ